MSDRVRVSIEMDRAHLPVLSHLLLVGGFEEARADRNPAFVFADYLTDELIAADRGIVDSSQLGPEDLEQYLQDALDALAGADVDELRQLDLVDVAIEEAPADG